MTDTRENGETSVKALPFYSNPDQVYDAFAMEI